MRKYFPVFSKQHINLDAYIRVENVEDEKGQVVSRFVRFNLDQDVIDQILRARTQGKELKVSQRLMTQLRLYALLDVGNRLQSGLTFCTYYYNLSTPSRFEKIVMRSVISLDGDIIQQVRQDCLPDSTWCLALTTAHHWLIHQLLNQLYFKGTLLLDELSWALSLVIVIPTVIRYIEQLNPWTLLASLFLSWFLQICWKWLLRLVFPLVRRWAFRQLLLRLLSPNSLDNKIAKRILGRLVS